MKTFILLAGAAMLAAAPAVAKPGGNGNGNGHGNGNAEHSTMMPGNGHGNGHGNAEHMTMAPGNSGHANGHGNSAHAQAMHGNPHGVVTHSTYGRLYALDRRGGCPPGLAKKGNGCLPPGQAKKLYNVGQHYNRNFGSVWTYDQIPDYLRGRYTFDPGARYYYGNGYLYQVDPRTMLVQQAISALLR